MKYGDGIKPDNTRNTGRFFTIGGLSFLLLADYLLENCEFLSKYFEIFSILIVLHDTPRHTDRFAYIEKILETQLLDINPDDVLEIKALDLTNCVNNCMNNADNPISHSFCIFYKGEKQKSPDMS